MSNLVSGGKPWRLQFGMFGGDSGSGEREREKHKHTSKCNVNCLV